MRKVLILGAGKIGACVSALFLQESDYKITVVDISFDKSDIKRLSLKYPKLSMVSLDIGNKKAAEELEKRNFQVNHIVIGELSEMTEEDLAGKEGKILFESTIKAQLNELMQEGEVEQIYITSYVIQ